MYKYNTAVSIQYINVTISYGIRRRSPPYHFWCGGLLSADGGVEGELHSFGGSHTH